MEKVLVHYSEIFTKGGHRAYFEDKLIENLRKSAEHQKVKLVSVTKKHSSILCTFDDKRERINEVIKAVFGVKDFSYVEEVRRDFETILGKVKAMLAKIKAQGKSKVSFSIKRGDPGFPLTSEQINKQFREAATQIGLRLDYEGDSAHIYTRIYPDTCYLSSEVIQGYGGLPVGTSGKVLVLLSGGIDSPVAAWQMIRRGCNVDFLHVHSFKTNEEAKKSKIAKFVELLNKYQFKSRLYLLPYYNYDFHMIGSKAGGDDLVLFKHYMFRIAEKLAIKNAYGAIVSGDNLGQVASQTLENIKATGNGITAAPIFRPLLTYDKDEIIELARKIGTYNLSIEEYKDCCSIVAKNPNVKTKVEKLKEAAETTKVDELVRSSMKEVGFYNFD